MAIVGKTFVLTDGSSVSISGVGLGAGADGSGTTQLFTVRSSSLFIAYMGIENCGCSCQRKFYRVVN